MTTTRPSPATPARRRLGLAVALAFAVPATAQEVSSETYKPAPVAGHPVFDLRVGVDRIDQQHPYLCGEISPLGWLSIEGCGTGNGFLHHGDEPDMAHFRTRFRTVGIDKGRAELDLLVGAGFAEVQRTADEHGFKFGKATEPDPIEAAGPEASVGLKSRMWLDNGGKTYLSGDLTGGAAVIPAAPDVLGRGTPVVPFAGLTVGLGF